MDGLFCIFEFIKTGAKHNVNIGIVLVQLSGQLLAEILILAVGSCCFFQKMEIFNSACHVIKSSYR